MTSSFVNLPLEKLMNRRNFISRLEKVEAKTNALPSARIRRLSEFSQSTGDQVVDTLRVVEYATGRDVVILDDNGISILAEGYTADTNAYKFISADSGAVASGLYCLVDGTPNVTYRSRTGNYLGVSNASYVDCLGSTRADVFLTADSGNNAGAAGSVNLYQDATDTKLLITGVGTIDFGNATLDNVGNFISSTWTPTATAGTNISATTDITVHEMNYIRLGNQVSFNGLVEIDTTAIGAFTCYLSLPIASNFNSVNDANGNGTNPGTGIPNIISIREDQTNDRLQLDGYAQVNTNLFYRLAGGYIIK